MRKILVTGGAGFIGSHVVDALVSLGHGVIVLDDMSSGKIKNLQKILDTGAVELVRGSVCDPALVRQVIDRVDAVVHLAALVSVVTSVERPRESFNNNALGTFNVFEAARLAGVKGIVYASSAAVYGSSQENPINENSPLRPLSPYASDKLYAEAVASAYCGSYNTTSIGLRFFNVYGERQDPLSPYTGVISKFVNAIVRGDQCYIYGDGAQTRDFVSVVDVVKAITSSINVICDSAGGCAKIFNVGSGVATTVKDLYERLALIANSRDQPSYLEGRAGEVRHSLADVEAIQSFLDWKPSVDLSRGLSDLFDYTKKTSN